MVKTIVQDYHWSPSIVGELYIDDLDMYSLGFYYDTIVRNHEELKAKK